MYEFQLKRKGIGIFIKGIERAKNYILTITPRARMGSESIAHEGERNNCLSKIQLVGQKYRE